MKLLNYTTSYFAVILIFLLSVWAVIFYFEILDEIYDSMDDGLDNQKMLVIRRAERDPSILQRRSFEDGNYIIMPTDLETAKRFKDSYRDTLMFMENEEEYEPVRVLESVFRQDGEFYKIKVATSMVEEDDLRKELFFSLIWLYIGLVLSILLLNNVLHKKVWKPFYKLLQRLERFSIEKDIEIKTENTKIDEFRLLNDRVSRLLKNSVESYNSQKEFIENASHELQTPLAISINKLELMAENAAMGPEQLEELGSVLNNLERLTRLNRSLLLLSKIENRQFPDLAEVNFNELLKDSLTDLEDLALHHEVKIDLIEESEIKFKMSKDLARVMVSNLLKNAILHSPSGSTVKIDISQNTITFENPGPAALDQKMLFSRFQGGGRERSTGLGLAISKTIADKYDLQLSYSFSKMQHFFVIKF